MMTGGCRIVMRKKQISEIKQFFKQMRGLKGLLASRKVVIICGLVVVAVAIAASSAWYLQQGPGTSADTRIDTKEEAIKVMDTPQQDYDRQATAQALAAAIRQSKNPKERADLYQRQALVESQQGKFTQAAALYESSLKESNNQELYFPLAETYEKAGNKPKAAEYYQKARSFYEAKDQNYQGRTYYLTTTAQKLKELR